MTDKGRKSDRTLWMLGAAVTLPMILVSGPLAGYILGHYVLAGYLNLPSLLVPISIGFGFIASGLQAYRLIKQINESDSKKDNG